MKQENQIHHRQTQTLVRRLAAKLIVPLAIIVAGGTFIHYWQVKTPKELLDHYKTYAPTVSGFEKNELNNLFEKYEKELPSGFEEEYKNIQKQKSINYSTYTTLRNQINSKYKIFNFPTARRFWFMFFFVFNWLICAILISIALNTKSEIIKTNLKRASYLFIGIASFWMFWVFFNDIIRQNNYWYVIGFLIASGVSSIITIRIIKYFTNKKDKLRALIRNLFRFLLDNERKERIKEDSLEEYKKERKILVKQALDTGE